MTLIGAQKPIVAAVQGPAVGVGTTMLLHCDLVYASEQARFHLPFVNLALVPEAGSSYMLPQMSGHQRAAELLMLGEPFDAQTAHEAGFVNAVVADDAVLDVAAEKAADLAAKPPAALRLTKALLKGGAQAQITEAVQVEASHFAELLHSPEALEAFTAFVERRQPDFSKFA
jgi:enoyl-CoA hydratase/carnithine racemase